MPVVRQSASSANVPIGPVVAPLPSGREGGARKDESPSEPVKLRLPVIKTANLERLTREIDANARKGVTEATEVKVKQGFRDLPPRPR